MAIKSIRIIYKAAEGRNWENREKKPLKTEKSRDGENDTKNLLEIKEQ